MPLALAPPSIGDAEKDTQPVYGLEEKGWTHTHASEDTKEESQPVYGLEDKGWMPARFSGDALDTTEDDDDKKANLFYRILTSHIMPFFLLLQWVLEVYYDEDDYETEDIGLGILLANVALFAFLMFFYRQTMQHNLWALLAPVIFLTVADTLVLFHCATMAFWVMAGGLLGMAGTVLFDRCYNYYYDHNQEIFINEREWMLKEDVMEKI